MHIKRLLKVAPSKRLIRGPYFFSSWEIIWELPLELSLAQWGMEGIMHTGGSVCKQATEKHGLGHSHGDKGRR